MGQKFTLTGPRFVWIVAERIHIQIVGIGISFSIFGNSDFKWKLM